MDNKQKYLGFIQAVINRMAGNSFLIKGWGISLISALFALAAKDANDKYVVVAYIPVFIFWILDGYYLWQEKLFRALYDHVRLQDENIVDYSMNTSQFSKDKNTWICSIFSKTLGLFYLPLISLMIIAMFFIQN